MCLSPAYGQELEEIVVTAQKREQNLQEVPISITAITGDQNRNWLRNHRRHPVLLQVSA